MLKGRGLEDILQIVKYRHIADSMQPLPNYYGLLLLNIITIYYCIIVAQLQKMYLFFSVICILHVPSFDPRNLSVVFLFFLFIYMQMRRLNTVFEPWLLLPVFEMQF